MPISKEAEQNKPHKPLNAYFKFRTEKLNEMKDDPDRVQKAKNLWEEMDEKSKE